MHVTGPLLEWFEANRPDTPETVEGPCGPGSRWNFSPLGMYKPILAILPDRDKLGQINRMNTYIEDMFGVKPQGMWTAERGSGSPP